MITLEPGTLFCKRYEILGLVGAGGMGAVYRACDPHRRDFVVALKILYPGVIRNADARKRFKNEIIASYRVDHENVIRAYEYFDEPQFQAYAMEFVAGGDLAERMQAGGIAPSTCLNLLCQLANGLDVIHRAGIVHRDIKPENILISEGDIAKIGDFGVARLKDRNSVTQEGAMVGTPRYVSPEYVETGYCDQRGDIYALGIIAYEMLAGEPAFAEGSSVSIMMQRFRTDPRVLVERLACFPAPIVQVVSKAITVDIEQRYQSANEFHTALSSLHDILPSS